MKHAGPLACPERNGPCHHPVRQGGEAEEKAASGGGTEVELGEGLSGLCNSFVECDDVQVSGEGDDGERR